MAGGPSWQGTEIHDIQSKTYIIIIATKVKHSNTTFNYDILMLTNTLNDNIIWLQLHPEHFKNKSKVVMCVCIYDDVCMCVRTRESAFSWCLKKSIMMHDDRIGILRDAVSLSVNDSVNCNVCMTII